MASRSSARADDIVGGFEERLRLRRDPPIRHTLRCSLEELYQGATKRVNIITGEVIDPSGTIRNIQDIETINIKRGWMNGQEITFPRRGNTRPGVIFTVAEEPHAEFTRDGNDLIVKRRISLTEALTGYCVHLTTLDGRKLTREINDVIHPIYEMIVQDKGMPIHSDPVRRGILKIKFDIRFPKRVNDDQKKRI